MYCITDEQVEYILNDIRRNGVEMEDLQLNLLDHICCKVEQEFKEHDDFERFYKRALKELCNNSLYEIEEETINLLTFKNYYFMKKAMLISGAVAVGALILGSFFKLMYWPGASILLTLGIFSLSLIFLPLVALLKAKEVSGAAEKGTTISGALAGIGFSLAVIFAVMHWPGGTILWLSTICISLFVFIPLYFFTGIRKPEKKMNTIVISILLVGATCLQFTMVGLRRPAPQLPMFTYLKNDQILNNMMQTMPNDANNKLVADINKACNELKGIILIKDIDTNIITEDFQLNKRIISERLTNFAETSRAYLLLAQLRQTVAAYNATKANGAGTIPTDHSILSIDPNELNRTTNLFVLNSITQLQIHLAIAEHSKGTTAVAVVR